MNRQWYVKHQGRVQGPFSPFQLQQLIHSGQVSSDTLVAGGENGPWTQASTVPGLWGAPAGQPHAPPVVPKSQYTPAPQYAPAPAGPVYQQAVAPYPYDGYSHRSKIVAGLLALFFGFIGVHNFYLGRSGIATCQLLLTILSCFVLSFITAPWAFIDMILIFVGGLNDGEGRPLRD